ncbi:hypothetical protein LOTGIDRAFT_165299 [Lottia gigantea]|uniref:Uncharacterized protein n=1 Tax=Lottia gigantea TaxID=225164 RepID=V3ZCT4_LOTGI|nr:hypothetical protein LOTGIDRAFT_165299 [Lottia gigantea]ESO88883.1 hypothetical protein LOTGIDRAFT_165299 [Lottia gigantea]
MNNFISLLNTTLHQEKVGDDKSDDEATIEEETLKPIEEIEEDIFDEPKSNSDNLQQSDNNYLDNTIPKSVSMPSIETLADTSRLMQRIQLLHTDCVKGVGVERLKRAYDILNNIEDDEVEPKLVALLGKDDFDEYAGKIWQLKFCEESLFTAI